MYKLVKNELILPVDVDSTLILYDNALNADEVHCKMYGGEVQYFRPHKYHIQLLKHHFDRGYHIIVWSANGFDWAEKVVKSLGLEEYVHTIMTKPREYVDDKNVEDWLKCKIYLNEDGY